MEPLAVRLYRALATRLVADRSREASREMGEVFEDAYEDCRHRGLVARVVLVLTSLLDLVLTRPRLRPSRPPAPFAPGLLLDLKLVFRGLTTSRFGVFVVVTLALGIGANTAIFSVARAVLFRPLPLAHAERVLVPVALRGDDPFQVSVVDYEAWREATRTFDGFGLSTAERLVIEVEGEPEPVTAARITPGYLDVLGTAPLLGRGFVEDDACCRESPVALIAHGLWERRYGGRDDVLGETLRLDGVSHAVLGVMPAQIDVPFRTDVWTPLALDSLEEDEKRRRDYFAALRLAPGRSREEGLLELRTIASRLEASHPKSHSGWAMTAVPLRAHLLADLEGRLEPSLAALLASVGILFLIACANVSNLFLTRAFERRDALAVRAALGASRLRLTRLLVTESLVLSLLGGALAVLLAHWLLPALQWLSPIEPLALGGRLEALALDWSVLLLTLGLSVVAGLGLGILSTARLSASGLARSLGSARRVSKSGQLARRLLVSAQVALALCLAVGAGLTAESLRHLRALDLGFDPTKLVAVRALFVPEQAVSHAERVAHVEAVLRRVRAKPEVASAGITTNLPVDHLSWDQTYTARGGTPFNPDDVPLVADRIVSPGYLETLGVRLVAGRLIEPFDRADSEPVVVITRDLAERAWPGESALGKQIKRGPPEREAHWMRVVGVIEPVKEDRAAYRRDRPAWYSPFAQVDVARDLNLVVRADGADTERALVAARDALRESEVPLRAFEELHLESHLAAVSSGERFGVALLSAFSILGLVLAAVGIYGVLSSAVAGRRAEIGLRVALGADPSDLVRRFTAEGLRLAAVGTAVGLVASIGFGRLLAAVLFGVGPAEPGVLAAAAGTCLAASLAASYLPARRATAVDAARVLRAD